MITIKRTTYEYALANKLILQNITYKTTSMSWDKTTYISQHFLCQNKKEKKESNIINYSDNSKNASANSKIAATTLERNVDVTIKL